MRPRALHRLPDRRRLCRADRRRPALLLCDRPALRRCRGGAADVRRADRLPHPADGRRRAADRDLRLWRRRAYRGAGGAPPGPADVRLHPARRSRRRRISRARSARNGPGARTQPPPEPLDAALIFAPVGALVPAALAATKKGGTVVCGRHPYERHPVLPLPHPVGGARAALGRQPDPPRRRGISRLGARSRHQDRDVAYPLAARMMRSPICATAPCKAPPCWSRDPPGRRGHAALSLSSES